MRCTTRRTNQKVSKMQTYTNRSNARRAGEKLYGAGNYDVAPALKGGFVVVQFADEPVAQEPWQWPTAAQFADALTVPRVRKNAREERNGVKKPCKGVCAELWAIFDKMEEPTLATVKAYAASRALNENNASIEFYAWRKFNA
jgi:hypothetical protein